jgi:selenocysteine lyase/cysteine desulfurase
MRDGAPDREIPVLAGNAGRPHRESRRSFLRRAAVGTAGLAALPLRPDAVEGLPGIQEPGEGSRDRWVETGRDPAPPGPALRQVPHGLAVDESYWEMVKAQFLIRPGIVPLNAANLCPAPRAVVEAVAEAGRNVDGDVSFHNRAAYDELREEVRADIAAYLGASADEIALVRNTSEGNNTIVGGLPLGPGDEAVIFDQNHPTLNVAWDVRAARQGFTVRRIDVPSPPGSVQEVLDSFLDALGPRTRVLAFSDISNVSGVRIPVREVCRACRERGIHSHVDGAQSFGMDVLNLHDLGCDSYATSAHKWFMGPKEAGVLYVRRERIPDIWPLAVGVGWGTGPETSAQGARKFETLGQRNDATFAGLAAALEFHRRIGPRRVEARVAELAARVKEGFAALDADLLTSSEPRLSGGVVVADFPGVDTRSLYDALYREHGVAAAPTGGLRFCPHVYNIRADVDRALEAVEGLLRRG